MAFNPRKLRHRVHIDEPIETQHPTTGDAGTTWKRVYTNVPAQIEPFSVREFIQSQSYQGQLVVRITIRYHKGLTPKMRIVHGDKIYNAQGWLADVDSGINYLTAPCTEGVNEG